MYHYNTITTVQGEMITWLVRVHLNYLQKSVHKQASRYAKINIYTHDMQDHAPKPCTQNSDQLGLPQSTTTCEATRGGPRGGSAARALARQQGRALACSFCVCACLYVYWCPCVNRNMLRCVSMLVYCVPTLHPESKSVATPRSKTTLASPSTATVR